MAKPAFLQLRDVSVGYGKTQVIDAVDLDIAKGEFVALLGSSGCGKTTLLRTIAGFVSPSSGAIRIAERDITTMAADKRGMALVFQSYALWPHMTVAQNIGYGLRLRRLPRAQIEARVGDMEKLLGLSGLGSRKPAQLSGGQRQRVALGRALAINPEILLLDEPLSNLDARIRLTVRDEIRALQLRLGITAIHVTHDREEAMVMADRIVILDAGRIAQQGTPEAVYNQPASPFVAAIMGAENRLELFGTATGDRFEIAPSEINKAAAVPLHNRSLRSGAVEARFRAEAAELMPLSASDAPAGSVEFLGEIAHVSYPGGTWRHAVRLGDSLVNVDAPEAFPPGHAVRIRVSHQSLFLFSVASQKAAPPHSSALLEVSEP